MSGFSGAHHRGSLTHAAVVLAALAAALPSTALANANRPARNVAGSISSAARSLRAATRSMPRMPRPTLPMLGRVPRPGGPLTPVPPPPVDRGEIRNQLRAAWGSRESRLAMLADNAADAHVGQVLDHSRRSGRYVLVSDLHWGRGRTNVGRWDPGEDFRQSNTFVRLIGRITSIAKPTTLVIGGDWLELTKMVDADAEPEAVRHAITATLEGHALEVRALAHAAVSQGLRIVYLRGNHDVQLSATPYRTHMIAEIARIARLGRAEAKVLKTRMAWAGMGAPLGTTGEALIVHGDIWDAVNNWRSPANPFDSMGRLESNLGWHIVATLVRSLKGNNPRGTATLAEHTLGLIGRAVVNGTIGALIRAVFLDESGDPTIERERAARLNDRIATRAWAERTGFAAQMDAASATPRGAVGWAREVEAIIAQMPAPVLRSVDRGTLGGALGGAWRALNAFLRRGAAQRELISQLTGLPGVRWVIWGHDHRATRSDDVADGKGATGQRNSGSWTRRNETWQLNAVVMSTDADGHVAMNGMFRTEQATGRLLALTAADVLPDTALSR
jgi:UDP-2,3-diacylglucosamine pyrophosphatase LpxH